MGTPRAVTVTAPPPVPSLSSVTRCSGELNATLPCGLACRDRPSQSAAGFARGQLTRPCQTRAGPCSVGSRPAPLSGTLQEEEGPESRAAVATHGTGTLYDARTFEAVH
jgi:hypothetical protein